MKKIFLLLSLLFFFLGINAQGYISYSRYESADCIGDLDGKGGVLLLSQRNDLVISITNIKNAKDYTITPTGKRSDGFYAYEIVANSREINIEASRRGEVFMTKFVVSTKPNVFIAYLIENVERPIQETNRTRPNDAILDERLAEIEFVSPIEDLKIECPKLLSIGGKISTKDALKERGTVTTSLIIPVTVLIEQKLELEKLKKEQKELIAKLTDPNTPEREKSEAEWDRNDQLEAKITEKEQFFAELTNISIYAKGTNRLSVSLVDNKNELIVGPRIKLSYGILLLKNIEKVHVSECSGYMEEAGRQFELREYESARKAFVNALKAKDRPDNMVGPIQTNIAQCDSCVKYERFAMGALSRMKQMRDSNTGTQEGVVKYASAALEFLNVLEKYNPCDFYSSRIEKLESLIEDLPLDIKFTIVKWVNTYSGFYEGDRIGNVEIWANYGTNIPAPNDYSTTKRFNKLVGSTDYKMLGESDENGVIELHLNRKELPIGLFFRPVGNEKKIKIKYMDVESIMRQSEGTYNKRQFRLKMYTMQKL